MNEIRKGGNWASSWVGDVGLVDVLGMGGASLGRVNQSASQVGMTELKSIVAWGLDLCTETTASKVMDLMHVEDLE